MKTTTLIFLLTFMVGVVLSNIAGNSQYSESHGHGQNAEIFVNDEKIKELFMKFFKSFLLQLISHVKKIIEETTGTFKVAFQNKLLTDVVELRARIGHNINNYAYINKHSGEAAAECMMVHRIEADTVINASVAIAMSCAESRQAEMDTTFSNMVKKLKEASKISKNALKEMFSCFRINSEARSQFSCLVSLAVDTHIKAISFLEKYGLLLVRFNTAMSTFPSALDECAKRNLVEAGNTAAAIAADIESCPAVSGVSKLLRSGVSSSVYDNSGDEDSDDDNQDDDEDDNNEDSNDNNGDEDSNDDNSNDDYEDDDDNNEDSNNGDDDSNDDSEDDDQDDYNEDSNDNDDNNGDEDSNDGNDYDDNYEDNNEDGDANGG